MSAQLDKLITQEPALEIILEADLWRLLGLIFDLPTPDAMAMIANTAEDLCELLEGDQLGLLLGEIARVAANTDTLELEPIYHWLFTTNMLATPYEGPYCATERGAVIGDIAAFYNAFGLTLSDKAGSPDSIVHEVRFLSLLALKESFALQNGLLEESETCRQAAKAFIEDHIGRWSPHFVNKVLTATEDAAFVLGANLLTATTQRCAHRLGITEIVPLPFLELEAEEGTVACPASRVMEVEP